LPSNVFALTTSALFLFSDGLFAYTAFWAFNIRRAQTARIYRNQALGMGFVALVWIIFSLAAILPSSILTPTAGAIGFCFIMLGLFYWVDASIIAARRSDPLLRDTLRWSELRTYLWGLLLVLTSLFVLLTGYYEYMVGIVPQSLFNLPVGFTFGMQF
jgi:hypothetical protein